MDCQIPAPLPWQKSFLATERRREPRLICLCVGRRSGKSHASLLWLLFNAKGLIQGRACAWLAPSANHLAETRSWFKNWCAPLIAGPSPGDLGFQLVNGARLDFWSIGPGATAPVRGRGYECVVIDEASFVLNLQQIIEANVMPALSIGQGKLLVSSTPRGYNDFHGVYLQAEREGLAIKGPSVLNPLLRPDELEKIRKRTSPLIFSQEYLAEFVEGSGSILKREQIRRGDPPERGAFELLGIGVDLALTIKKRSDYSAVVTVGRTHDGKLWILDAQRWRATWPETRERIKAYALGWNPDLILVEEVAFQELAVRELAEAGLPVAPTHPSKDKIARFLPIHSRFAHGQIVCSHSLSQEYLGELLAFPDAPHDDYVDASVYAATAVDPALNYAWRSDSAGGGYQWEIWKRFNAAKVEANPDPEPAIPKDAAPSGASTWRFAA